MDRLYQGVSSPKNKCVSEMLWCFFVIHLYLQKFKKYIPGKLSTVWNSNSRVPNNFIGRKLALIGPGCTVSTEQNRRQSHQDKERHNEPVLKEVPLLRYFCIWLYSGPYYIECFILNMAQHVFVGWVDMKRTWNFLFCCCLSKEFALFLTVTKIRSVIFWLFMDILIHDLKIA